MDEAKCGMLYSTDSGLWVFCDSCDEWYNLKCTNIKSKKRVPEVYIYVMLVCSSIELFFFS